MNNKRVLSAILGLMILQNAALAESNQTKLLPKSIIETMYPNWFIVQKGSYYVDEIFSTICSFPESVTQSFLEKGNVFIISSDKNIIERTYKMKRVVALYDSNNGIIWIEATQRGSTKAELIRKGISKEELADYTDDDISCLRLKDSVIHELAHFLDGYPNYIYSGNQAFFDIYISERESYENTKQFRITNCFEKANISSSFEYFASSLSAYYLFGDDLLEYAPRTYKYMDELINTLSYSGYGL